MSDGVLFIDANTYLYLYNLLNSKKVQKILTPLEQLKDSIFVTEQIVDEVYRNKVEVAKILMEGQFSGLKSKVLGVPYHLLGISEEEKKKLRKEVKDIQIINEKLKKLANGVLASIVKSEDKISKSLSPLFESAIKPTREEINSAQRRRVHGNPPGKNNNPLGDQLNWEQLLKHCKNQTRLWLITADTDFFTRYEKSIYLNAFLQRDLSKHTSIKEVYCFNELIDGLADFIKKTGKKTDKLPSGKEAKEINQDLYPTMVVYNPATGLEEALQWSPVYGLGLPTFVPGLAGMPMANANTSVMAFGGTRVSPLFSAQTAVASNSPGTLFVSRHPSLDALNDDKKNK